jgi:hypothetical protein
MYSNKAGLHKEDSVVEMSFTMIEVHIVVVRVVTHLCSWYINLHNTNVVFEDSGVWDVALFCWVSNSQHFKGLWCLHIQGQAVQRDGS